MQRQDVARAADSFQGNIQQQTDERFSSGPDRASAQAATRQLPVKIKMYLHNGILSRDHFKLLLPN